MEYDEEFYTRPEAQAYINNDSLWVNLVDMIQTLSPTKILDFGSGLGHVIKIGVDRGLDIMGCETSEYALEHTFEPDRVIKIEPVPKKCLPWPNNEFDLVFSSEVMEHIEEINTKEVIKELYRICSNKIFLTIESGYALGHINLHPRDWWLAQFRGCGFKHSNELNNKLDNMKIINWGIYVFEVNKP